MSFKIPKLTNGKIFSLSLLRTIKNIRIIKFHKKFAKQSTGNELQMTLLGNTGPVGTGFCLTFYLSCHCHVMDSNYSLSRAFLNSCPQLVSSHYHPCLKSSILQKQNQLDKIPDGSEGKNSSLPEKGHISLGKQDQSGLGTTTPTYGAMEPQTLPRHQVVLKRYLVSSA